MNDIQEQKNAIGIRRFFKKPGKNLFWAWIAYQAIKGTATTCFIWIPLLYIWFSGS